MSNLAHRQQKIQEKRKQTPWRKFLLEVCAWKPVVLGKNEHFVSRFPESPRVHICSHEQFADNRDTLVQGGQNYDVSLGFFDQFARLFSRVSLPPTIQFYENENAQYGDIIVASKDVYLSYAVVGSEHVLYSESVKDACRNVFDSLVVIDHCENVYRSCSIYRSMSVFFSHNILDSNNIRYSANLQGCSECIDCQNLERKQYCIANKEYSREEYMMLKHQKLTEYQQNNKTTPLIKKHNIGSNNSLGEALIECEGIEHGLLSYRIQQGRNVIIGGSALGVRNFYDVFSGGAPTGEDFYAVMGGGTGAQGVYCSSHINGGASIFYSYYLENCSFCLGCIGLKNKQFCIFNKQYTKEEWYKKADEIFRRMEEEGTLGDFFPGSMNPFYFNDTAAYLIDNSFTKEEVTAAGYLRRDEPIKVDIPAGVQTVKNTELDQFEGRKVPHGKGDGEGNEPGGSAQRRIHDEILKKVILDEQGNAYRVIPMELEFLRKHGLPLPRKHWLERMKENFRIG